MTLSYLVFLPNKLFFFYRKIVKIGLSYSANLCINSQRFFHLPGLPGLAPLPVLHLLCSTLSPLSPTLTNTFTYICWEKKKKKYQEIYTRKIQTGTRTPISRFSVVLVLELQSFLFSIPLSSAFPPLSTPLACCLNCVSPIPILVSIFFFDLL